MPNLSTAISGLAKSGKASGKMTPMAKLSTKGSFKIIKKGPVKPY